MNKLKNIATQYLKFHLPSRSHFNIQEEIKFSQQLLYKM